MIPITQTQALLCASHQTEKELFTFRLHFSCHVSYTLPCHVLSSSLLLHFTSQIFTLFFLLPQVLFFLTPRPPSVVCSPCSWPNTRFVCSLVCLVFSVPWKQLYGSAPEAGEYDSVFCIVSTWWMLMFQTAKTKIAVPSATAMSWIVHTSCSALTSYFPGCLILNLP